MTNKKIIKPNISVIIPTNGKRIYETSLELESLKNQIDVDCVEVIMVSEGSENFKNFGWIALPNFIEVTVPKGNGIFLNFIKGAEIARGDYLFFLDDDMVLEQKDLLISLKNFLDSHPNVWAVGPFINEETGSSTSQENIKYDSFKRKFKIWDPDDYTNKVYSCYGKGSANHRDTLPDVPYIGCMWLSNGALLIRRDAFLQHSCDDLHGFSKYWPIQRIWAVDFFTTYKLYLKKKDALAFIPSKSVLHLGAGGTSFNISDRIIRETICGYYYYKRYMRNQSFIEYFVRPTIGRLFYIFKTSKSFRSKVINVYAYFKSLVVLLKWKSRVNSRPQYISEIVSLEEPVKVLKLSYE